MTLPSLERSHLFLLSNLFEVITNLYLTMNDLSFPFAIRVTIEVFRVSAFAISIYQ